MTINGGLAERPRDAAGDSDSSSSSPSSSESDSGVRPALFLEVGRNDVCPGGAAGGVYEAPGVPLPVDRVSDDPCDIEWINGGRIHGPGVGNGEVDRLLRVARTFSAG